MSYINSNILVVDDDPAIQTMITTFLGERGINVLTAGNGRGMTEVLGSSSVDLVLLDVQLPDDDGMNLVRRLRADSGIPIIVVSGHRRKKVDCVIGLELGADDYLIKPFSMHELFARIGAVMRRCEAKPTKIEDRTKPTDKEEPTRICFAGWELDLKTRRLTSPAGALVPLTKSEFNLLVAFLHAPQQVLSREQLLASSHMHNEEVFDRSIDVHILRLRRKLEADPAQPVLIRTERGAGYVFAAAVKAS
jgi:two-component system, OmpR family, response regulator